LSKGTRNVRTFGIPAKIGKGDLQIEKCDVTVSPYTESPSEPGDSEVDQNYSLRDNSYSDSSDNNISSLHEVKVFALNEP
jgi:hypothetical protein